MAEGMEYRKLGRSGLKVSRLGFGYMTTGLGILKGKPDVLDPEIEQSHFEMMQMCINAGINFFDSAEMYGKGIADTILGRNLKQGGWDRDELVITSKLNPMFAGIQGMAKKRLRQGFQKSLERMQLDNVDIVFLHRFDFDVPLKEQISTLNEFIENDQAYYWGTSEYNPQQLIECHHLCEKYGWISPIVDQCEYSMLRRDVFERDYAPIFDQYGMGTTTWGPLGGGLLTGKYNDGTLPDIGRFNDPGSKFGMMIYNKTLGSRPNNGSEMLKALANVAKELNCTQAQLALAWVLKNDDVSLALFGSTNPKQLEENLGALKIVKLLDKNVLERIEEILGNRPVPATKWLTWSPLPYRR
jgi:aryl-alcohol dehydrogenase-like predicted oxidoreductase